MKILVDGYNLIHAIPDLRGRLNEDLEETRNALVVRLSSYAAREGVQIIVVFDGQGMSGQQSGGMGNVRVRFSKAGQTADEVIKKTMDAKKRSDRMQVVTSDAEIRRFARLCSVPVIQSQKFVQLLSQSASSPSQKSEPSLSSKEVDEWMRLFGKKQ